MFYSGAVSRAPKWMREHSLEWVWRLLVQPRDKAKRYLLGNPLFLIRAFKEAVQQRMLCFYPLAGLQRRFWRQRCFFGAHLKRSVDLAVSVVVSLMFLPLLLTVALLIRCESKGAI